MIHALYTLTANDYTIYVQKYTIETQGNIVITAMKLTEDLVQCVESLLFVNSNKDFTLRIYRINKTK